MDEERRLVLKMLAEGKITPEEAERLLDALEGSSYGPETSGPEASSGPAEGFSEHVKSGEPGEAAPGPHACEDGDRRSGRERDDHAARHVPFETRFERAIRDIVEGAVDQATKAVDAASKLVVKVGAKAAEMADSEGIGGVLGVFDVSLAAKASVERAGAFLPDASGREIKVDVANGRVSVAGWDGDGYRIEARGRVRGKDLSGEELSAVLAGCIKVDEKAARIEVDQSRDRRVTALAVDIRVPRSVKYQRVSIDTSNGSVEVSNLFAERLDIDTSNGPVSVSAVDAREVSVDSSNGPVAVKCRADDLSCDTSHGPITVMVEPLGSEAHVNLDTSFGPITVVIPDDEDLGVSLKADTSFGKIRAQVSAGSAGVLEAGAGSKAYQAATPGFESKPRRCIVKADTSFGSIEVRRGRMEEGAQW